jgi:outer membrane cobalamin receptor
VPLSAVVVSASRFPNDPAFPPVAATVITAEQIREAGIDNANEAIRKLGVCGRQSLSGPRDFPLDLRGFGTNGDQNMVVLVDGVRISENELSTPLLSAIPIETIERIEIVRGGSSVLCGSGATGGTIQIITRRPQANAVRGTVVGEVGSNGQRAGRAAVSRGWDNMSIDASYASRMPTTGATTASPIRKTSAPPCNGSPATGVSACAPTSRALISACPAASRKPNTRPMRARPASRWTMAPTTMTASLPSWSAASAASTWRPSCRIARRFRAPPM